MANLDEVKLGLEAILLTATDESEDLTGLGRMRIIVGLAEDLLRKIEAMKEGGPTRGQEE